MAQLNHLKSLIVNTPLLCTPEYMETLCAVLGNRMNLDTLGMVAQDKDASLRTSLSLPETTRVIPIVGSMTHRSTGVNAMSGSMLSYASLQAQVEDAMADKAVKNIMLDIDSGGGQVAGAFDFRDYLLDQRGRKPIVAMARDTMASAAYLIGSATDKIYVTQTGSVGSIGVVAMHIDQSAQNEAKGVKPTFIYAGDYKTAGNPHAALEGEALSYLQESVNDSYEMFISAVAEARDITPDAVRATQARMYRGEKAVAQGLADGVSTFDLALTELATSAPRVYQSMSIQSTKESLMDPEEIAKLQADLASATASNETLRAAVIAEGYSITAEGLAKAPVSEMIEIAGIMTAKDTLPEHVVAALVQAKETAEDNALTELATATLPNFELSAAKALLKTADEAMITSLKAADAAMGHLMSEVGSTDVEANMMTASEKMDALVKTTMKADGISLEAAKTKVSASAEGRELFKLARKETK